MIAHVQRSSSDELRVRIAAKRRGADAQRGRGEGPQRLGWLLELLSHGELDLALIHLGKDEQSSALRIDFDDAPVEIERLYAEPLVLAVGPRHRLAGRRSVRWKDLAGEEFVSFGPGSTVRDLLAGVAQQTGIPIRTPISAANLGTVRALVSAGLGVAILPRVALTLPGPPLRGIRITAPALTRIVALACNTIRYESPAARTFAAFLREGLRP